MLVNQQLCLPSVISQCDIIAFAQCGFQWILSGSKLNWDLCKGGSPGLGVSECKEAVKAKLN